MLEINFWIERSVVEMATQQFSVSSLPSPPPPHYCRLAGGAAVSVGCTNTFRWELFLQFNGTVKFLQCFCMSNPTEWKNLPLHCTAERERERATSSSLGVTVRSFCGVVCLAVVVGVEGLYKHIRSSHFPSILII